MIDYIINILKGIFNNEGIRTEPDPFVEKVEKKVEKKVKKKNLKSMTKKQLESYGRELGIELDRRHNKTKLIARLEEAIAN